MKDIVARRNAQLERENKRLREALTALSGGLECVIAYRDRYGMANTSYHDLMCAIAQHALDRAKTKAHNDIVGSER